MRILSVVALAMLHSHLLRGLTCAAPLDLSRKIKLPSPTPRLAPVKTPETPMYVSDTFPPFAPYLRAITDGELWICFLLQGGVDRYRHDLVIEYHSIGVASQSNGILGLDHDDLTNGTVHNTGTVPTTCFLNEGYLRMWSTSTTSRLPSRSAKGHSRLAAMTTLSSLAW